MENLFYYVTNYSLQLCLEYMKHDLGEETRGEGNE